MVKTLSELVEVRLDEDTTLFSFATGVIVPSRVLGRLVQPDYNLHPASPGLLGRDPHHHAIYRDAREYGAALHIMTSRVYEGPIVECRALSRRGRFDTYRSGRRSQRSRARLHLNDVHLGPLKFTRADLLRLCTLYADIAADELERRIRAFLHDNLTLILHGWRFKLERAPASGSRQTSQEGTSIEAGFLSGHCEQQY